MNIFSMFLILLKMFPVFRETQKLSFIIFRQYFCNSVSSENIPSSIKHCIDHNKYYFARNNEFLFLGNTSIDPVERYLGEDAMNA